MIFFGFSQGKPFFYHTHIVLAQKSINCNIYKMR